MKQFSGFEVKKSAGAREFLPVGGYVAKIMGAKEIQYDWGTVILISFDIAEGDFRDFFLTDYRAQDSEDKKWRGTYRLREPNEDGSEKDNWTIRAFNNAVAVLEESNNGYHWNWTPIESGDFSQLKGKLVGVLYRNEEWSMNGNTGWSTKCCALASVEDIRKGKFRMPKDKPLKTTKTSSDTMSSLPQDVIVSDDDLPF